MTEMSRFRRLEKLEFMIQEPSFPRVSVSTVDVDRLALMKLSPGDRELVQKSRLSSERISLIESHPLVWERWSDALAQAMEDANYPIRFSATDWGL